METPEFVAGEDLKVADLVTFKIDDSNPILKLVWYRSNVTFSGIVITSVEAGARIEAGVHFKIPNASCFCNHAVFLHNGDLYALLPSE